MRDTVVDENVLGYIHHDVGLGPREKAKGKQRFMRDLHRQFLR